RGTAPDNPVLRAAFEEVTRKPRRKFAGHIAGLSSAHFRDTALRQLHKKGWVEECETTAWLLFPALGYRLKDGEIVTKVVARMRAVLDRSRDQDAVGTALVALAYQAKLLPYFLSSEEIAAAKTRLTAITRGADATAAVRSAIASIDAALAASITANAAVVASID
nr:GPP34 family phosphoprotein [Gammaproteobacteria bacterium]